jgi:transcriptional regulator with XRE-family HTH domain
MAPHAIPELTALRKSHGLSLADAAISAGITAPHLCRIERGKTCASPAVAARLAKLFAGQIDEMHILYPERYTEASR